jgi:hypothetical protein
MALSAGDATLDVATLDGALAADDDDLSTWLISGAGAVADVCGRMPVEHVSVVIEPVAGGKGVELGLVTRGGGPGLMLLVGEHAKRSVLLGDWVLVHELSHLLLPALHPDDAWLSEGFATYLQVVLRARAGLLSPEEAWSELDQGFGRGRGALDGHALVDCSTHMHEERSYLRVYWAGAAIALHADIELRKNHGSSLDAAICGLRSRSLPFERTYRAAEILQILDEELGHPVLSPIADAALRSTTMLDVDEMLRVLHPAAPAEEAPWASSILRREASR